jgi:superfamily I DNA/RNA helicase
MHKPTPEQQDIINAAKNTQDNIQIKAIAGAAKTTTLEMISHELLLPILSLQFNKRNADEAKKRMPPHVECKTFNGCGHGVWGQAIGKRLVVDTNKMHKIVKMIIDARPQRSRSALYDSMGDTLNWLRRAKRDGYTPSNSPQKGLINYDDWCDNYADEPEQPSLVNEAMSISINQALAGNIDFDDQLFMPVIFGGSWPRFPLVMADEAQDLSPINHVMLTKLVNKRVICVGDPWQSIYGFRGAVQGGMAQLSAKFNCTEFPLSVSFRVPKAGVERARSRVAHMQWCDWATEGHVEALEEWSADTIKDGSAIICRNNAPLFSAALRLIRAGRNIKLVGMDIGPSLVKILKKLGPITLNEDQMQQSISMWANTQANERNASTIFEKAECLSVLCHGRKSLQEAILFSEELFKREGPIQLLSGHKAKGLEWDTVYHLDPWRIPSKFAKEGEEYEQELNVKYVIETRFKQELFLIDMEGYHAN